MPALSKLFNDRLLEGSEKSESTQPQGIEPHSRQVLSTLLPTPTHACSPNLRVPDEQGGICGAPACAQEKPINRDATPCGELKESGIF